MTRPVKARSASLAEGTSRPVHTDGGPIGPTQGPTTSFLTATTYIYAIGAGITAAACTRLALQWILVKGFRLYSFQLPDSMSPVLLFIVTTSPCQDWVICAPAAFLGCGSRFSGSLSGIEP
ncbi:hypothetical protein S245_033872 [Arachis hypogaea]